MQRKVIFAYNSESGVVNALWDYMRRNFSSDYQCQLALITHGPVGMRGQWKSFVRKLDVPLEFLSRDKVPMKYPKALYKQYPKELTYPCVLLHAKESISVLITTEEIKKCSSVDELKDLVTQKLLDLK
jgi:hypothetical protein